MSTASPPAALYTGSVSSATQTIWFKTVYIEVVESAPSRTELTITMPLSDTRDYLRRSGALLSGPTFGVVGLNAWMTFKKGVPECQATLESWADLVLGE